MNIDIAALKQAAQAATPGAWRDGGNRQVCIDDPSGRIIGVIGELWSGTVGIGQADANMAHICAARPEVVLELIARLERAEAGAFGGYVIQHADGDRWRTIDSIGMPDWTDDEAEALRFALRKHADAWAGEDPEDVRIVLATAPAPGSLAVDAAKWRALIGSARIRVLGTAGLHSDKDPYGEPWNGYAHIGLELWTKHDAVHEPERAVDLLERYAAIAAEAAKQRAVTA